MPSFILMDKRMQGSNSCSARLSPNLSWIANAFSSPRWLYCGCAVPCSAPGCPGRIWRLNSTVPFTFRKVALMAQLVWRHSCGVDRLPVVVRFPAGPWVSLKTVDPPKGNGLGKEKVPFTFRKVEGELEGEASRGASRGFKRASRGLQGGFKGPDLRDRAMSLCLACARDLILSLFWHLVAWRQEDAGLLDFFLSESELVAFRRVYGLESYSWTSEESNHHRQSVSDTRVPRYHNWRTRDAQLLESWKSMKSDFRRTGFKSIGKKLMPRPRRRETLFFVCFVCVCFALFVLFGSFVVFFGVCIVTAYWTVYWSYFSTAFEAHQLNKMA